MKEDKNSKIVTESLKKFCIVCINLMKDPKPGSHSMRQLGELAQAVDSLQEHTIPLLHHAHENVRYAGRLIQNVLFTDLDLGNQRYSLVHAVTSFTKTGRSEELEKMVAKWACHPDELEVLVDDLRLIAEDISDASRAA